MSGDRAGLADILQLLGTRPDASEVITAMVTGPMAEFGAHAGIITATVGTDQVIVGEYGYPSEIVDSYRVMPNTGDYPMTRAFQEQTVLISGGAVEVVPDYSGLERDDDLWERVMAAEGYGSLVAAPIVLQGRSIGTYGFSCTEARQWTTQEIAMLEAYGAALGLWLSHPGSVPEAVPTDVEVSLTARQLEILRLVRSGRSNVAIAAALSVSDSTVKGELRRICAALNAASRHAAVERAVALGLL